MTILLHRQAITFINPGKWNKKLQRYEGGGERAALSPSPQAQEVPDWIAETEAFQVAERAGVIVRIQQLSPAAQPVAEHRDEPAALGFGAPEIEHVNLGRSAKKTKAD